MTGNHSTFFDYLDFDWHGIVPQKGIHTLISKATHPTPRFVLSVQANLMCDAHPSNPRLLVINCPLFFQLKL